MPAVADTIPLYTILFGDLPLLVTRELVRLVAAASDLRLVGPVRQDVELASQVQNVRPSVIIVSGSQLAALSGSVKSVPVLLYESEIDTDLAVRGGEHRGRRLERDRAAVKTDILVRRDAAASYVQLRRTLSALQHTRTL